MQRAGAAKRVTPSSLREAVLEALALARLHLDPHEIARLGRVADLDAVSAWGQIDGRERRRRTVPFAVDVDVAPRRDREEQRAGFGSAWRRGRGIQCRLHDGR